MPSYLDFLNKLLAIGGKLPQLWPIVLQVIDLFQQAIVILGVQTKLMGAESPSHGLSTQEHDAEQQVATVFAQHEGGKGAIGDGSLIQALRNAWTFISSNPALLQIVQILLGLFLKPPTPTA